VSRRIRLMISKVLMVIGAILLCSGPFAMIAAEDVFGIDVTVPVEIRKPVYNMEGEQIGYVVIREEFRPTKIGWIIFASMFLGVALMIFAIGFAEVDDCP